MTTETITLEVDADSARAFAEAPEDERRKLQLLLSLRLRELTAAKGAPLPVSAPAARQMVNRFVITEISTQLLGDTPEWKDGERPCWSVPVLLTSPARGVVGKVGDLEVVAATGELLADEETVRRMTENARHLAERSPL